MRLQSTRQNRTKIFPIAIPIDGAVAGHQSQEKILWTDELRQQFFIAQKSLASHRSIIYFPGHQPVIDSD